MKILLFMFALLALPLGNKATGTYRDPDGGFSLQLPAGWTADRKYEEGGWMTLVSSDHSNARIMIGANPAQSFNHYSRAQRETLLRELGKPYFSGWHKAIKSQARTQGTEKVYKTLFKNAPALRMDVTYYRGDKNDPRQTYGVFFFGEHTVFFLVPSGDQAGFREADKILSTFEIEPAR